MKPALIVKGLSLLLCMTTWMCAAQVSAVVEPPKTTSISGEIKPEAILHTMETVAQWQLNNPSDHDPLDWIRGAGDAGLMALVGIAPDAWFRDQMVALGQKNGWQLGKRPYHADDHCVGQTWAELYQIYRDPRMIQPLRERFDFILAHPSQATTLDFNKPRPDNVQEKWSWCDALFMAPTAWIRLYSLTGDSRYLDFAVTNWWQTTDYLYDKEEHLFFRDSTYFKRRESNGKKIFWSRGNGWVMAGLVRVLQYLPDNHPDRAKFEKLFKEMAAKVLDCQQADGLWRSSLLDPAGYPLKETSGSGFFTYALAWGVNQGLLDHSTYEGPVTKAWTSLVGCVTPEGRLTHVQPVGADPKKFLESSTEPYGTGAFLLAGSEVYRMALLESSAVKITEIKVHNPAGFWRENETVEVANTHACAILDGQSSRIIPSQMVGESTLFQVDLGPGETRTYQLVDTSACPASLKFPTPVVKTFARYVPERYDDFAWESDRTAHRTYGQALIKAEGTVTSGPDVWIKRDRGLIVDVMYATKHYHEDNGEFMDDFRVGKSRGCGGLGIWDGKVLHSSSNYKTGKLIATGPIRSEFELTYDAWDAGAGRMVSEVKRYRIDAGSWFTHVESTFSSDDHSPLTIGVGLAERSAGPDGVEQVGQDKAEGWQIYWQPEDKPKGTIGTAFVLPKGCITEFTTDNQNLPESKMHEVVPQPTHEGAPAVRNLLAITQVEVGKPFGYFIGACWDRSGDFTNRVQWENYVKRFAERRDQPLEVTATASR